MSSEDRKKYREDLIRGLEIAEYRMLREKAMRNQSIVQGDGADGAHEVPAREVFASIYHEPVPTY